jgi:hypothetical protein
MFSFFFFCTIFLCCGSIIYTHAEPHIVQAWTNTSKEMPDSVAKIVNEIKKAVAKEKAV